MAEDDVNNESLEDAGQEEEMSLAEEAAPAEEATDENAEENAEENAGEIGGTENELLQEDQMNEMIEQLCLSKAEEFRLIGYDHVNGQDVWECVSDKYHKKGTPPLYQVVNDILSLKVTQFMNYITLNMYRGEQRG